jgi:hypothetical protein
MEIGSDFPDLRSRGISNFERIDWLFEPYITVSAVTLRSLCCIIHELLTFRKAFFSHLQVKQTNVY